MRVCDLCGRRYHEGIAVFGAGDDPLLEMDLCESHYLRIQRMIQELVGKVRAEDRSTDSRKDSWRRTKPK